MPRNVGATFLGLVVQGLVVLLVEGAGHAIGPPPPGLDPAEALVSSAG